MGIVYSRVYRNLEEDVSESLINVSQVIYILMSQMTQ